MCSKTIAKKKSKKYWYHTEIYSCVICGKENRYKERVFEESKKGQIWHDDLCWSHKL